MGGYAWVFWLGWTLAIGGGAMLIAWIIGRSPRGVRRCPACEYDMSGTAGMACPECGRAARSERAMLRRRRRRRWLVGAIMLLPVGVAGLVFNPGRQDGWASSLPRWAIWPVMPWFDGWTDGAVQRMTSAAWAPVSQRGARWDRLLIAQRCCTLAEKVETLSRQTNEERMAADTPPAPTPLPAAAGPATTTVTATATVGPNGTTSASAAIPAAVASSMMMYQAADPLDRARNEITGLIGVTGDDAGLAAAAIGRVMRSATARGDGETWWWAMKSLQRAKHVDEPTRRAIIALAKDPQVNIRVAALGTLVECRSSFANRELLDVLVAALDDPDVSVRKYSAAWIGNLGADGLSAVPRLTAAAQNDPNAWVRSSASGAIVMIEETAKGKAK